MPSRTPLGAGSSSLSSSSSSSSSTSSSSALAPDPFSSSSSFLSAPLSSSSFPFISYNNNQSIRHPDFPVINTITTSTVDLLSGDLNGYEGGGGGGEEEAPVRTGIGIRGRVQSEERSSLSSSLSSSRDERVYTPIYPSYSSSFSSSSMELHQLLFQAEALQQQQQHYHHLRTLHQQQQQQQQLAQEPLLPHPSENDDDALIPTHAHEQESHPPSTYPPSTHPRLRESFSVSVESHAGLGALTALPTTLEDITEATPETTRTPRTTVVSLQEDHFPDPNVATSDASDHHMHHGHDHGGTLEPLSFGEPQPHQHQHTVLELAHGPEPSFLDNNESSNNERPDHLIPPRHGPLLLTQSIDMQPAVLSSRSLPTALAFTPSSPSSPSFPSFVPGETFDNSDLALPETTFDQALDPSRERPSSDHPHLYTQPSFSHHHDPDRPNHPDPDRPYTYPDFDPSPYTTDTHLALSQVLATFQDTMDHTFPGQASRNDLDVSSSSSGPLDALAYLSSVPELDGSLDRSPGLAGLGGVPQAFFPRRRYATRDYSTGSISSEDWLHHPEVVTLGEELQGSLAREQEEILDTSIPEPEYDPLGTEESTLQPSSVIESTPESNVHPSDRDAHGHPSLSSPRTNMDSSIVPPQLPPLRALSALNLDAGFHTEPASSSEETLLVPLLSLSEQPSSNDLPVPLPVEARAPEIPTPVPDRLGLLGPLLSSSHTSLSLSSPSEGVSGRPLNGLRELDAARWTVASRIRQARLTRLLRLMGNREIPGYLDRYNWNRFAPAPDTQSMFNHASRSRGTSRAGSSIEDGTLAADGAIDHEGDVESEDPLHPNQQQATRDFVSGGPSRLYPAPCHTFAEILDCNGNPIECCSTSSSSGLSESYASSSTSSIHSHVEDGDEDGDWYSLSEARRLLNRRNRSRRHDDSNWGHGTTHPGSLQPGSRYGRTRVVSTGTVFEGLEHVSEADSLIENNRYQSLKSSWMTNPNGESWSDDESDNPQRNYLGDDDKETDATSTSRQGIGGSMHATLGFRHPNAPPGQPRGQELYYIYGNVRNRYGPEMSSSSFRRRRVMTEITDLLRREREWERELLQQYGNGEDVFGLFDMETSSQAPSQPSLPLQPSISIAPRAPPPVSGAPTFFASANPPRVDGNGNSTRVPIAATVTTTTTAISEATATPGVYSSYANLTSTNSTMLGSGAQGSDGTRRISIFGSHPNEGFQEYEQGHSHYHTREEDRGQEDARSMTSGSDQRTYQRRIPSLRDGDQPYHPPPIVHDTFERPLHHHAMSRQPAVALMNRTPPLLPLVPQSNEPIAHQIRRLNNAHMINLQRRFAHQQQQQLLQQQQSQAQAQAQASALQLMTNPHSYHGPNPSTSSSAMLTNEPPLLSRGSRSSFRSSEIDGANFNTREDGSLENTTYFGTRSSSSAPPSTIGGAPTLALTSSLATSSTSPVPTLSSSSTMVPPSSSSSSIAYAPSLVNQDPHNRAQYWRNVTRGSNSLYTNYEGGNLRHEDRWRRGSSEMVGR